MKKLLFILPLLILISCEETEEFFILEGDLTDPDGYTYKKGDFVHLSSGSLHYSTTSSGCTTVVTHRGKYIFTEK